MKNIFKNISILILCLSLLQACDDSIEGINTNPLAATTVDPSLLMPEILLAALSNGRTIESSAMNFHSQSWSASIGFGVFINPERYRISPNTTNNLWVFQQSTGLRNLQQMRLLTEENNPSALNIIGQAKTLEAFFYLNLTQVFGDMPFSESLNVSEFPNPNFDSQEEVLRGLIVRCDEAIDALSTSTDIIESGDLIFNGDRMKWIKFANSIKLKALMLIENVDPASVSSQIQAVSTQPLIVSNDDIAKLDYTTSAGNEYPIWKLIDQFGGGQNTFYAGGIPLIDIMNANDDPRRATYFDPVEGTTDTYAGQEQGVFNTTDVSVISLNIIRPGFSDIYISAAEINFYLAEAALKGYVSGNANDFYRAGIQASLDFFDGKPGEISQADKDAYMNSTRANILGDSMDEALNKIHEEIYVSNFSRAVESWTNWRRNKVPSNLSIPDGAAFNEIIRRYQIPVSEVTSNPNAPQNLPALSEPMYFEK